VKSTDLIAVSQFRSSADAQIGKDALDEAGIESVVQPDPTIIHWGPSQGKHFAQSNAAQLMVKTEDFAAAIKALQGHRVRSN
jgi:hypothetical protein